MVVAVAALLTLAMAWPVVVAPADRLFGYPMQGRNPDPFAMIDGFAAPLTTSPRLQPVTDVPGALLARLVSPVVAYNLTVLASFPLAAGTSFALARGLGAGVPAAFVAALLFAFAPFHVTQAAYHPHIAQVQWLPLYLLALWRALDHWSRRRAVALVAAMVLVTLSSLYGALMAAVVTLTVLVVRRGPHALRATVLLGSAALAVTAYASWVAPWALQNRTMGTAPAAELAWFGAQWWAYVTPPVNHPVLGAWAGEVFARGGVTHGLLEQQVFLGWSALALSAVAVGAWWRGRLPAPASAAIPALLAVALVAFVWSLAPGQSVAGVPLPAPAAWLHAVAPWFRAYARFGVVLGLVTALLAGLGAAALVASTSRARRLAGALLVALAAFEWAVVPAEQWRDVLPTLSHRWLASQPDDIRILDLSPVTVVERTVPALMARDLVFGRGEVPDVRDPDLAARLGVLGFTHLLYRRPGRAADWFDEAAPPPGLRLAARFDDSGVLAVDPGAGRVATACASGCYPREQGGGASWQWMGADARWAVTNHTAHPLRAAWSLELRGLPAPREVDVLVNGATERIVAGASFAWIDLAPVTLAPGYNEVVLRAVGPPVVPGLDAAVPDNRALAAAVGRWRWTILEPEEGRP